MAVIDNAVVSGGGAVELQNIFNKTNRHQQLCQNRKFKNQ